MWTLRNPEDQSQALVASGYQWDFATSQALATLLSGGWGSGKSYAGLLFCAISAMRSPPGSIGVAAQPTFPMMREWLQTQLLPAFRDIMVHHSAQDRCIYLPGRRQLYYRSAHIPQNIQMTNATWFYLDEPHIMKPDVWKHVVARIRKKIKNPKGESPLRIGMTSLPRMGWLSDEFDHPENHGEGNAKRRIMYAETAWNKHLDDGYSDNIKSVTPRRMWPAYLGGRFCAVGGTMHPEFDPRVHIIPWYHRPVVDMEDGSRAAAVVEYAIDWGSRNPHVLFIQRVPKGAMHPDGWAFLQDVDIVIDEIYPDGSEVGVTTKRLCIEAKNRAEARGYRMSLCVADVAGEAVQSTSGETDAVIARKYLGVPVVGLPVPKRSSSQLVSTVLDPAPIHPQLYFSRGLLESPYDRNPKRRMRAIIHAIQALTSKKDANGRPTDEAEKDNVTDHSTDAMRYWVWWHRREQRHIDVRSIA